MKLNYQLIFSIMLSILLLILIILTAFVILQQFSPFETCVDKPDNYTIIFSGSNLTCGELRAINTTI